MTYREYFVKSVFKWRGVLMVPPLIFTMACACYESKNKFLVFLLGSVLFALGMLLRLWAQMHIHYRLKVPKFLTTTGPYAYVRNPVYIANTIILVSTAFLGGLYWFTPVIIVYCIAIYSIVIRYEESHLLNKYGRSYTEYADETPRWVPRLNQVQRYNHTDTSQYLIPSLFAEAPSLLLFVPFIIKGYVS
jgi:protein-S-isoprenylcysteine O-methyltransferase Ste14